MLAVISSCVPVAAARQDQEEEEVQLVLPVVPVPTLGSQQHRQTQHEKEGGKEEEEEIEIVDEIPVVSLRSRSSSSSSSSRSSLSRRSRSGAQITVGDNEDNDEIEIVEEVTVTADTTAGELNLNGNNKRHRRSSFSDDDIVELENDGVERRDTGRGRAGRGRSPARKRRRSSSAGERRTDRESKAGWARRSANFVRAVGGTLEPPDFSQPPPPIHTSHTIPNISAISDTNSNWQEGGQGAWQEACQAEEPARDWDTPLLPASAPPLTPPLQASTPPANQVINFRALAAAVDWCERVRPGRYLVVGWAGLTVGVGLGECLYQLGCHSQHGEQLLLCLQPCPGAEQEARQHPSSPLVTVGGAAQVRHPHTGRFLPCLEAGQGVERLLSWLEAGLARTRPSYDGVVLLSHTATPTTQLVRAVRATDQAIITISKPAVALALVNDDGSDIEVCAVLPVLRGGGGDGGPGLAAGGPAARPHPRQSGDRVQAGGGETAAARQAAL